MAMTMEQLTRPEHTIRQTHFTTLLQACSLELGNHSIYDGIPVYDATLAAHFNTTGHRRHLRFDFAAVGQEVFVPLNYFSETGHHRFGFPIAARTLATDSISLLTPEELVQLIAAHVKTTCPDADESALLVQLQQMEDGALFTTMPQGIHYTTDDIDLQTASEGINFLPATAVPAGLFAPGGPEAVSRLQALITAMATRTGHTPVQAATRWFSSYLQLMVNPLLAIAGRHGLAVAPQLQHVRVQTDQHGMPAALYISGAPVYVIPGSGSALQSELAWKEQWTGDCLTAHLFTLIGALGSLQLADETALLSLLYEHLRDLEKKDDTGLVTFLLHSNRLPMNCPLLAALQAISVQGSYPNPLHKYFFSKTLINPEGKGILYSRYFPKEDIVVSIRSFDIDRDLEMVHDWFNREHAKKIWKMDWPLRELEAFYRTILPGNAGHSYIGEINGEPTYNFEVYWVVRDLLGNYYDALPTDYGTHQFIAPVDPKKKYSSPSTRCMLDWVFSQPQVGKMVGEGSVESLAALMNKAHVGFRVEKVIDLPHKRANLNFCYREWYWAKFPEAKEIKITTGKVSSPLK